MDISSLFYIERLQLRELKNHVQGVSEKSITAVGSVLLCHLVNKLQFEYIICPSSSTSDFEKTS